MSSLRWTVYLCVRVLFRSVYFPECAVKPACFSCCPCCLEFTLYVYVTVFVHLHVSVHVCMRVCKAPAAFPSILLLSWVTRGGILLIRPVPEARAPYTADVPLKRPWMFNHLCYWWYFLFVSKFEQPLGSYVSIFVPICACVWQS